MNCPKCGKRISSKSAYCMFCGIPCSSGIDSPSPAGRNCIICGRTLPEESLSDICETCLYGGESSTGLPKPEMEELPALEDSVPSDFLPAPRRTFPKWILLVIFIIIMIVAGVLLLMKRSDTSLPSAPSASEPSAKEQLALSYAQEMVKAAAFDPSSVHFRQNGLEVSEDAGVFTVVQRFDRKTSTGESLTAPFTAVLQLDDLLDAGYRPIRLEVDGTLLYDYGNG